MLTEAVQTPTTEADDDTLIAHLVTKRGKRPSKQTVFKDELPARFKRAKCSDEKQSRSCGMLYKEMPENIWYSSTRRKKGVTKSGREQVNIDYMFVMWDSKHRSAHGLTTKPFMGVDNMGNPLKPGQVSSTHLRAASAVKRYMDSLIGAEAEDPEDTVGNLDDDETIMTTDINALEEQVTTGLRGLQERQERLQVMTARPLQAPTTEVPAQENAPVPEAVQTPVIEAPVPEAVQTPVTGFVRRASFPAFNPVMWPPTDRANLKRAMEPHKNVEPELKRVKLVHGTFNRGYISPGVSINHVRGKMLHIENLTTLEAGQEQAPEAELVPTPEVRWSPDAINSLKALMRRFRHSGHSDRIEEIYGLLNEQTAGIPPGMGVQAPTLFTKEDIKKKIAQIEGQAGFRSPPAP